MFKVFGGYFRVNQLPKVNRIYQLEVWYIYKRRAVLVSSFQHLLRKIIVPLFIPLELDLYYRREAAIYSVAFPEGREMFVYLVMLSQQMLSTK